MKKLIKNLGTIRNTSLFLRLFAVTIRNITLGRSTHPEHLPVFKAPRGDNPEQNAEMIHAFNLEHLLVFKALCGDIPEQNASNQEHFTVYFTIGIFENCVFLKEDI